MAAFMVVSLVPNPALNASVAAAYAGSSSLALSPTAWLVSDTGITTKDVCDKLNIKEGGISGALAVKVESYFGFASPNIWEWLKGKIVEP